MSRRALPRMAAVLLVLSLTLVPGANAADNRVVFFGSPGDSGDRSLAVTPVTAGGAFAFDVTATNLGKQTLTHAWIGLGSTAPERKGWDTTARPSLPPGARVLVATLDGADCAIESGGSGARCDIGSLRRGASVSATFVVRAPSSAVDSWVYASLKVAENVNDVGSNSNSFFADSAVAVGPTTSDAISTFLLGEEALALGTTGQAPVAGDVQHTSVTVPGAVGGLVSLTEQNGPTGCVPVCIGQTVFANVRGGATLVPYLQWTLVIRSTSQNPNKGGIYHTLDDGRVVDIRNTKQNACSNKRPVECIELYRIDKKAGTTTIVFRTSTNGAVRAN